MILRSRVDGTNPEAVHISRGSSSARASSIGGTSSVQTPQHSPDLRGVTRLCATPLRLADGNDDPIGFQHATVRGGFLCRYDGIVTPNIVQSEMAGIRLFGGATLFA